MLAGDRLTNAGSNQKDQAQAWLMARGNGEGLGKEKAVERNTSHMLMSYMQNKKLNVA